MRKIHARARLALVIASGTLAACSTLGLPFGARDPAAIALAGWTSFGMMLAFVAVSAATMFTPTIACGLASCGEGLKSRL